MDTRTFYVCLARGQQTAVWLELSRLVHRYRACSNAFEADSSEFAWRECLLLPRRGSSM